ncbi:TetR/AcrR family transcriptional regulator [Acidobacteria bacterium AB60]|nr:TetR/AcrR family transcriptional regulator [Acidobacteria bacterium AB60]
MTSDRIADRKIREKQARRSQILTSARRIAEAEGWPSVTVRRLSDEISYSQPVLYSHFENRDAILAAVALEGFRELGVDLEKARLRSAPGNAVERLAASYLRFAESSPAMYEVMFSLGLSLPFGVADTPSELRHGFSQLLELFNGRNADPEVVAELFWSNLHGLVELTRTKRLPRSRQKERLRILVELFTVSR